MRSPRRALMALCPFSLALAASACTRPASSPASAGRLPRTRAELTGYRETSRYTDVVAFLDSLRALGAPVTLGVMGKSTEGRDIPYVVASRPLVATPDAARRLGRPVVYVQANIHAGEVEGKEALLALLRDLVTAPAPNVLDSIVLVAVPIYNADGNERLAPQSVNRTEQNGPELVGERANGQRLDLNRDYVKAEAPETRASLAMFAAWDPELFVDLHTTDGSFHGYALTYSPSLNPAAPLAAWTRDSVLPELRRRMRERHAFETFDYGNFSLEYGADVNADTVKQGWYSYDHRPRFGTNYYGLRGRVAILSEAFSHDPFERRVRSTYAYVSEILSLAAERGTRLRELAREADALGAGHLSRDARVAREVPVRSRLTTAPYVGEVIAEDLARVADTTALTQPGVPRGMRRTGHYRSQRMPVFDRFEPQLVVATPPAYALDAGQEEAVRLLRLHGVTVERTTSPTTTEADVFTVDSVVVAERPFQGHREVTLRGRWREERRTLPVGSYVVRGDQPLGALATYLLEPESDDGLVTWNVFDGALRRGGEFPVTRVRGALAGTQRVER
ncbi:MAG: M14 family metallopeptidase [Gemmatimonadaceae bacterium]